MVFKTKANAKNKQNTPLKMKEKKSFDNSKAMDIGDMDSDDETGNGRMVMSPGGKTPKGKRSLGDRKVSFQVLGKNTPGKNKRGSFVLKKQLTPENKGKTALKEFQGMKTIGKRKVQDGDDDNKDGDNDDGDDIGGADVDFDGLDADDDEDDHDEDDNDEEEDKNINTGVQNETKSPVKSEKTPLKSEKTAPEVDVMKSVRLTKAEKRAQRREKANRSLHIGNLPLDVEEAELKALSSDILRVFLPYSVGYFLIRNERYRHALLEFENDSKAKENLKILQKKKLRNSDFTVHYNEVKTEGVKTKRAQRRERRNRSLYIGHLPLDVRKAELKALSSDIVDIDLPHSIEYFQTRNIIYRHALLEFENDSKAEENLKILRKKKLRNSDFTLDYCEVKGIGLSTAQRRARMKKSLYIGHLPLDVRKAELKALSSGIRDIDLPHSIEYFQNRNIIYRAAFLVFASYRRANKHFKILQKKKLRNSDFTLVRNVGRFPDISIKLNKQKISIVHLPMDTAISQVAHLFPKAWHIQMKSSSVSRFAKVLFNSAEIAAEALEAIQDAEIFGKKFSVVGFPMKNRNGENNSRTGPAAKKARVEDNDDEDI